MRNFCLFSTQFERYCEKYQAFLSCNNIKKNLYHFDCEFIVEINVSTEFYLFAVIKRISLNIETLKHVFLFIPQLGNDLSHTADHSR